MTRIFADFALFFYPLCFFVAVDGLMRNQNTSIISNQMFLNSIFVDTNVLDALAISITLNW
jgi:F0F1-type ATP synthase membrane subunit c/vacuolar-type H+-ATPase subunit K